MNAIFEIALGPWSICSIQNHDLEIGLVTIILDIGLLERNFKFSLVSML